MSTKSGQLHILWNSLNPTTPPAHLMFAAGSGAGGREIPMRKIGKRETEPDEPCACHTGWQRHSLSGFVVFKFKPRFLLSSFPKSISLS